MTDKELAKKTALHDIHVECIRMDAIKRRESGAISIENKSIPLLSFRDTIALINSDEAEMLHNNYFQ